MDKTYYEVMNNLHMIHSSTSNLNAGVSTDHGGGTISRKKRGYMEHNVFYHTKINPHLCITGIVKGTVKKFN